MTNDEIAQIELWAGSAGFTTAHPKMSAGIIHLCQEVRRLRGKIWIAQPMIDLVEQQKDLAEVNEPSPAAPWIGPRRPKDDEVWMRNMAAKEDGCIVSVGGMVSDMAEHFEEPAAVAEKPALPHSGCFFHECPTPAKCAARCESGM